MMLILEFGLADFSGYKALAQNLEQKGQFSLALPLFFQALRLCQKKEDQCHQAVISKSSFIRPGSVAATSLEYIILLSLVNNVAACFAQHPPHEPPKLYEGGIPEEHRVVDDRPWKREKFLEYAQNWATNALTLAKETKGENRTAECDQACAVASINLGDIVAMAGDPTGARRWYKHGIKISKENGYVEGVQQAQAGLARLA